MKKLILSLLLACCISAQGCHYLDMDPETGLDENQVFSTWDNFKAYFNNVYEGRTGQKAAATTSTSNWVTRSTSTSTTAALRGTR